MNKTIFNLDYKISIIIVSFLGILLGFLSNAFYVNGIIGLVIYLFKLILFSGIYVIFYFIEKNNKEFKLANKRMSGYLLISAILNIIFSIFSTAHLLSGFFLTLSGIVCFWLILSFISEIINVCLQNKIINKIINVNEKIGLAIANPIIKLIDSKITND